MQTDIARSASKKYMKFDQNKANNVIFICPGGLGDTISFSPVIRSAMEHFVESSFHMIVASRLAAEIYSLLPSLYCIKIFEESQSKIKTAINFLKVCKSIEKIYDFAFLPCNINPFWRTVLKVMKKSRYIYQAPSIAGMNDFKCNQILAKWISGENTAQDALIPVSKKSIAEVKDMFKKLGISEKNSILAIYPSVTKKIGGKIRLRVPLKTLFEASQKLIKEKIFNKAVIIGSKIEGEEWMREIGTLDNHYIIMAGKLSANQTSACLMLSKLAICNDGGIAHLALHICPTIALICEIFSSYYPEKEGVKIIWLPYRKKSLKTLKYFSDISPESVVKSAISLLSSTANHEKNKSSVCLQP